jgi:hypothetical protein
MSQKGVLIASDGFRWNLDGIGSCSIAQPWQKKMEHIKFLLSPLYNDHDKLHKPS